MNKIFRILFTSAFPVGFAGLVSADEMSTRAINLRTGPGVRYPTLGVVPGVSALGISGCVLGYRWCCVNYRGIDGWASSRFIQLSDNAYSGVDDFGVSAAAIGIPLIAGLVIGSAIKRAERHHDRSERPFFIPALDGMVQTPGAHLALIGETGQGGAIILVIILTSMAREIGGGQDHIVVSLDFCRDYRQTFARNYSLIEAI